MKWAVVIFAASFVLEQQQVHSDSSLTLSRVCLDADDDSVMTCVFPEIQVRTHKRVYLVPSSSKKTGVRIQKLISEGLDAHPFLENVQLNPDMVEPSDVDAVIWIPASTPKSMPRLDHTGISILRGSPEKKTPLAIVVDEMDSNKVQAVGNIPGRATTVIFKRSWIQRLDGRFNGSISRPRHTATLPFTYPASDDYHHTFNATLTNSSIVVHENLSKRNRPLVSTLRCDPNSEPTRCRILSWCKELVASKRQRGGFNLRGVVLGGVNNGNRKSLNSQYFQTMREARIVVTCNPSYWVGDFRFMEAMMSGALVFVDEMHTPMPHPLINGTHVIIFDPHDRDTFLVLLRHYMENPEEARVIARAGYLHVLKYHRAVSCVDYLVRTANVVETHQGHSDLRQYAETGFSIASNYSKTMTVGPEPLSWSHSNDRGKKSAESRRRRTPRPSSRRLLVARRQPRRQHAIRAPAAIDYYDMIKQAEARAGTDLDKCALDSSKTTLVTSIDHHYSGTHVQWQQRMTELGWHQRVVILLDNSSLSENQVSEHDTCFVRYFHEVSRKGGETRLPIFTGLSKFSVLASLLHRKFVFLVFSEMDVFWFRSPWKTEGAKADLACDDKSVPLLGADNVHTRDLNIGFLAVCAAKERKLLLEFFDSLNTGWRNTLLRDPKSGTVAARDQSYFNSQLLVRKYQDIFSRINPRSIVLNSYDRCPIHTSTLAFHATGMTLESKQALLSEFYNGSITKEMWIEDFHGKCTPAIQFSREHALDSSK